MDDKWFKRQQKRAGVTAEDIADKLGRDRSVVSRLYVSRQKMTLDQARVFADVLQVPLETVLEKAGIAAGETAFRAAPGFSDSDVLPFIGKPTDQSKNTKTAETLGGDRPGVDVWQVKSDALILNGYLPGDFILVDTHAAPLCKAGDVVLAQMYNAKTGTATTILRRYEPPVLVSANTNRDDQRAYVIDGTNVVIMGRIAASWRV